MKNLYKVLGLLALVAIIMVGCSTDNQEPTGPDEDDVGVENEQENDQEEVEVEKSDEKSTSTKSEIKSNILKDMMDTKEYTMKLETIYEGVGDYVGKQTSTNVVTEDKTYLYSESDGTVINVVEKDGKSYLIMHDSKTIIVTSDYSEEDAEVEVENIGFFEDGLEYIGEGNEDFLGSKKPYEEYKMDIGAVKYYFEGNQVDGAKITIDMEALMEDEEDVEGIEFEDTTILMDIVSFEKEVDMSVFELPEDYEMVGE